jgi:CheY-like chemotaxis protein
MAIKRALVVDDSKSAGLVLRRMLEQQNIAVDMAESGEAAIKFLRSNRPDVVFMDHIMPGMNGLEAAKAINTNPQTTGIPIVMYTSTEGEAYAQKAKAHGAIGILSKPPKVEVLTHFIRQLTFAAPAPAEAAVTPAAPPAVPPTAAAPAGAIEEMARHTAESAAQNAVQLLVTRVLQEQLSELRQDLVARAEDVARQATVELAQAQFTELEGQLKGYLQAQLGELQARIAKPIDQLGVLEEITKVASSVAIRDATEVATQTAQRVAQQAARDVAMHTASDIARQAAKELVATRTNALADQLRNYVNEQLAEFHARPGETTTLAPSALGSLQEQVAELHARIAKPTDRPELLEEITKVASTVAIRDATEVATQTAQRVAQQTARDVTMHTAGDIAREAAKELVTTRTNALADQLRDYVNEQLAEFHARPEETTTLAPSALEEIKSVARAAADQAATTIAADTASRVADQLYAKRARTLTEELRQTNEDLRRQVTELRRDNEAQRASMRDELRNMAQSVAARVAVDALAQATRPGPPQTGSETAKHAASLAVRLLESSLITAERAQRQRTYVLAGAAAAVGMIASAVVFLLNSSH